MMEKLIKVGRLLHGEKKTVESTDVICWNRDSSFFCNIYRFFCWIHGLFVNSTDEPVKSTEMSVRITDFSFFLNPQF